MTERVFTFSSLLLQSILIFALFEFVFYEIFGNLTIFVWYY